MEEHVMESMQWAEAWVRTSFGRFARPGLRRLVGYRQRASIMSEEAVWIGVIATVGLTTVVAFLSGLGTVLQNALAAISGQV